MTEYDIILKEMKFSYSSLTTFNHCRYAFLLTYIRAEARMGNFFSDFGSYVHKILEKYFNDELDLYQLAAYYRKNYKRSIKHTCPAYPKDMALKYFSDGLSFFENFEFEKEKYEIIDIEKKLKTKLDDINFVLVPDLVLKEKKTNLYHLFDYKTANLYKNGKLDKKKVEEYKQQCNLYVYFLYAIKGIEINRYTIWAIRNNARIEFLYEPMDGLTTVEWIKNTVDAIRKEEKWEPNTSEPYFCSQICSNRFTCPYVNHNG